MESSFRQFGFFTYIDRCQTNSKIHVKSGKNFLKRFRLPSTKKKLSNLLHFFVHFFIRIWTSKLHFNSVMWTSSNFCWNGNDGRFIYFASCRMWFGFEYKSKRDTCWHNIYWNDIFVTFLGLFGWYKRTPTHHSTHITCCICYICHRIVPTKLLSFHCITIYKWIYVNFSFSSISFESQQWSN